MSASAAILTIRRNILAAAMRLYESVAVVSSGFSTPCPHQTHSCPSVEQFERGKADVES